MKTTIVTYGELLGAVFQGEFDRDSLMMNFNDRYGDALRPMMRGSNHSCTGIGPWFCNEKNQIVMERAVVSPDMEERTRLSKQAIRFYRETAEPLFLCPIVVVDGISKRVHHWEPWNDDLMGDLVELED